MVNKILAAVSKAIAAIKAEIWGYDQQGSPNHAAPVAVAPGQDRDVEDLRSKLSHVKEGLELALARVAYLERSIHNKERNLGVGPDDRLVGSNRLKRGRRRDEMLAERAKELWREEEEEGGDEEEDGNEKADGKHGENITHGKETGKSENGQQQVRLKNKRKGMRGGGGGANNMPTNEASAGDDGSESECGTTEGKNAGD